MQLFDQVQWKVLRGLGMAVAGLALLAVACGTSATATPQPGTPAPGATPTPARAATAAPLAKATSTLTPSLAGAAQVSPDKLTWMTAGWSKGRFTLNFGGAGVGNNYARILHGFLIPTNEKTELLPGIATKWEISADGKSWTVTIRDGAKFHDGKSITAADVWWTWMHYWGKDESGSALERATQSATQALARNTERIEQPRPDQVSITT